MKVKNLVNNIGIYAAPVNLYVYSNQFKTERVGYAFFEKAMPVAQHEIDALKTQGYWDAEITYVGIGQCGSIEIHAVASC